MDDLIQVKPSSLRERTIMENYGQHRHEGDFELTDIRALPDAVRFGAITGPKARQLADLALHQRDLQRVAACLQELNSQDTTEFIRSALWQLAVITFVKCFVGGSARICLNEITIFGKTDGALEAFRYFKNIRDKHFVHDENSYAQCVSAVAINDGTKPYNVEKIVALSAIGETLEQANFNNLNLATQDATAWVEKKFDDLCATITDDLEKLPREELMKLPDVSVKLAEAAHVSSRRTSATIASTQTAFSDPTAVAT